MSGGLCLLDVSLKVLSVWENSTVCSHMCATWHCEPALQRIECRRLLYRIERKWRAGLASHRLWRETRVRRRTLARQGCLARLHPLMAWGRTRRWRLAAQRIENI